MNVIVSNKNENLLNSLDIDTIKSINGEFTVEEIIGTFSNFFFNRMFLDITAIKDYLKISNIQKLSMSIEMDKVILLLDDSLMNNKKFISKLISVGIYNFGSNKNELMYLYNHPNTYKDVAPMHNVDIPLDDEEDNDREEHERKNKIPFFKSMSSEKSYEEEPKRRKANVIGFKSMTSGAGATTLVYMLKKVLSENDYVVALEVNKNDFGFFNEKDMYSVNQGNLSAAINKFSDASTILVDINNGNVEDCDEVIYLMEPSTIKLNKMMLINKDVFNKLHDKKIVLNKSLLTQKDVFDFESESRSKIAFNLQPLNDRNINREILNEFMNKLDI